MAAADFIKEKLTREKAGVSLRPVRFLLVPNKSHTFSMFLRVSFLVKTIFRLLVEMISGSV